MSLRTKQLLDYFLGGLLAAVIGPLAFLLGKVLNRKHFFEPGERICFLKLLGGGSLLIAYPGLLGLRAKFPEKKIELVTTPSIVPFAEVLGIFDSIHCIDDRSLFGLVWSSIKTWISCLGVDTVIDLEVYSRMSSVFCTLTCARNRFGFYLQSVFWRKMMFTHLIFFNKYAGSYHFYEQLISLMGSSPASDSECRAHILKQLAPFSNDARLDSTLIISHACSENATERMLSATQWKVVLTKMVDLQQLGITNIKLLGSARNRFSAERIINLCRESNSKIIWENLCGTLSLKSSVLEIAQAKKFIGIDSGLLHFARILKVPSVSFWGPTHWKTRLKPIQDLKEDIYQGEIFCSPCVHVAERAPCGGNNICIQSLFEPNMQKNQEYTVVTLWPRSAKK